jgi:hypothetical protein
MSGQEPGAKEAGPLGPAYYAQPHFLTRPAPRDWWTVLHPPYTAWHLSYVVIGACLLGPVDVGRLLVTVLAFFLAVGVGAHALDELHGRPLRTTIPDWALVTAAAVGLGGAVVLGIIGSIRVGPLLSVFIFIGVVLAIGYNLELLGGRLHTDAVFAASWGAFPLLTAYFAQHDRLSIAAGCAAVFAFFLSAAQRELSTPARALRRRALGVEGAVLAPDGSRTELTAATVLGPLERALRSISWAVVALAVALALVQTHPGA